MALPGDIEGLSNGELKALVVRLLYEIAALKRTVSEQREEIARLKGLKGRPQIKPPSGMEQASEPKPRSGEGKRRGGGDKTSKRTIHEDRIVKAEVPAGARFKGYENFVVQDLVLRAHAIRYRRERWVTPDGRTVTAPLPAGVVGHFAWFATTSSKSRLNFLDLLRAGHTDYVINAEALSYMRGRALSSPVITLLAEHPHQQFPDGAAFKAHLDRLGITALRVTPDPVGIATEGALWGSVKAHGFLPNTVIVSDDAGQFDVGQHALCWVHAERLVHKLDTFTDQHRNAQQRSRSLIWQFYKALKVYQDAPSSRRKTALRARFDRIFCNQRTGFVTLDRLLTRLHANKAELLMVLDRPEIPLHTNGSENDIRCQVTKRKISGGTRSDAGRDCRDAFLSLAKTCAKLGITFWGYLGARLAIPGQSAVPDLPNLIKHRCATA